MRAYSGREIIKLLSAHGWEVARIEGRPSHPYQAGARRDDLSPGAWQSGPEEWYVHYILKVAGIRLN